MQSCGRRSVNNTRAELWRPERKALNAAKVINDYGVCVKMVHIDFQVLEGRRGANKTEIMFHILLHWDFSINRKGKKICIFKTESVTIYNYLKKTKTKKAKQKETTTHVN